MENSKVLNILNSWIENKCTMDVAQALKLKGELEQEVRKESAVLVGKGYGNKYKLLSAWMKKIPGTRPALQTANIQDLGRGDRMCITDSFLAFYLKNDIKELPHTPADTTYPVMKKLFNDFKTDADNIKQTIKIDKITLNVAIKAKSECVKVGDKYFDPKMLQFMLNIMETSEVILIEYCAFIENDLGESVLMMIKQVKGITDYTHDVTDNA